jgi:HEAT repeat protein
MTLDSEIVSALKSELLSTEPKARQEAVALLVKMGKGAAVLETLEHLSVEDADPAVRYQAGKQLAAMKGLASAPPSEAVRAVEQAEVLTAADVTRWLASPEVSVRLATALRLARSGRPDLLPQVLERLGGEQDPWVLSALVRTVGLLGSQQELPALQRFLQHRVARVVAGTVEAIAAIGEDLGFPLLVPMLEHDDHRVRASAVQALFRFDRARALAALSEMAASPEERLRASALYLLAELDDQDVIYLLRYRAEQEPLEELLEKACVGLVARKQAEDLGLLVFLREHSQGRRQEIYARFLNELKARLGVDDLTVSGFYRRQESSRASISAARAPTASRSSVVRVAKPLPPRGLVGEDLRRWLLIGSALTWLAVPAFLAWHWHGSKKSAPLPAVAASKRPNPAAAPRRVASSAPSTAAAGPTARSLPVSPASTPPAADAPPWERVRQAPRGWPPADWQ